MLELTRDGLDAGPAPKTTLFDALIPSLEQVGGPVRGVLRYSARARP